MNWSHLFSFGPSIDHLLVVITLTWVRELVKLLLCLCRNARDLDDNAEENGLEEADCWAMICDPTVAQVCDVILCPSCLISVVIKSPMEVVCRWRCCSNIQDDIQLPLRKIRQGLFLNLLDFQTFRLGRCLFCLSSLRGGILDQSSSARRGAGVRSSAGHGSGH